MNANATCQERVKEHLEGRIDDLRRLWEAYQEDSEAELEDLGRLNEYGFCFDYVAPETFNDQDEGYFRYQLSTGGPGDEFRVYADGSGYHWSIYKVEYWFLDWFDGARLPLYGDNLDLIKEIMSDFVDCGTFDHVYNEAMKDF